MGKWKKGGRGRPPNKVRLKNLATSPAVSDDATKRTRFEKTATGRMNRALGAIHMIGNLASNNYGWKPEDVKVMRQSLIEALDHTFGKFQNVKTQDRSSFTFETKPSA